MGKREKMIQLQNTEKKVYDSIVSHTSEGGIYWSRVTILESTNMLHDSNIF